MRGAINAWRTRARQATAALARAGVDRAQIRELSDLIDGAQVAEPEALEEAERRAAAAEAARDDALRRLELQLGRADGSDVPTSELNRLRMELARARATAQARKNGVGS